MQPRKGIFLILILLGLTSVGTLGFYLIEGWSLVDSLYMSIITLSTVGFEEVHPLSPAGRVFVMIFLVVGLGFFLYGVVQIAELAIKTQLHTWFGRRKMDSIVKNMNGHFIICGFGRMGRALCQELDERGESFIAVDEDEECVRECNDNRWPIIRGDASDDDTLLAAGIERAAGIACVLSSDADNLYVVMSARLLNSKIQIISRAGREKTVIKMKNAGADRVVSVYGAAGSKMARLLTNPDMEDYFEIISARGNKELDLAEVQVRPNSDYVGKTIAETGLGNKGVVIVGIRRKSGQLILPPTSSDQIMAGDYLIAMSRAGIVSQMSFA